MGKKWTSGPAYSHMHGVPATQISGRGLFMKRCILQFAAIGISAYLVNLHDLTGLIFTDIVYM